MSKAAKDNLQPSPKQMRELNRRLDILDRGGSTGEKWDVVEKRLLKAKTAPRPLNHLTT
jgi:hypothetical protein